MNSDFSGSSGSPGPSDRPLLTKVAEFAYWIVIAVIFAWAAWLRFRQPLIPIIDPDTKEYLWPAMDELAGRGFTHHLRNYFFVRAAQFPSTASLGYSNRSQKVNPFRRRGGQALKANAFLDKDLLRNNQGLAYGEIFWIANVLSIRVENLLPVPG
jgi:hypothetical protein